MPEVLRPEEEGVVANETALALQIGISVQPLFVEAEQLSRPFVANAAVAHGGPVHRVQLDAGGAPIQGQGADYDAWIAPPVRDDVGPDDPGKLDGFDSVRERGVDVQEIVIESGTRRVNVVPSPGLLCTTMEPSCSSTIFRATASPMPTRPTATFSPIPTRVAVAMSWTRRR